jgi:hypothetical protein
MRRRSFLKTLGALGLAAPARLSAEAREDRAPAEERAYWVQTMTRIVDPVLTNLARGTLKARMPVEQHAGGHRERVTHLEAFGRTMAGLAPWLELGPDGTPEGKLRAKYIDLSRQALSKAVDPSSPDFMNFHEGGQPLVDAAFLANALLRAPRALREGMDAATHRNLAAALASSRTIVPGASNWVLFTAMVEAALREMGEWWDPVRVEFALRDMEGWYVGDGTYGDGAQFHWDYYNSYVIQPFLLDILGSLRGEGEPWAKRHDRQLEISRRYAEVQERLIAPDGTYPILGRSIAYRFGAFQLLGLVALRRELPPELPPAQVRSALSAVVRRVMSAPGNFDANGWLRIGVAGSQPSLGEGYISTGSLYLCTVGLLPLGLPASDPFWTDPPLPWTSVKVWGGKDLPTDHALG